MTLNLKEQFGPIISDEESLIIYNEVKPLITKGVIVKINFDGIVAMSTKSAKTIFGRLYGFLGSDGFYNKIHVINATNTIKEIIYDSIVNYVSNIEVELE